MDLPAYALVTLAEFKDFLAAKGPERDDQFVRAIIQATQDIEDTVDRRLIYRAPTEDDDQVVASAAITTGALAVAGQPGTGGRTLVVTVTKSPVPRTDPIAGLLTVTGTVGGVVGQTETFDLGSGDAMHGLKFFTAVSAVALASVTGAATGDRIKVGTSLGYVEYHSPSQGAAVIRLLEDPVQYVAEVNEDVNRSFAAATALTAGTAYEIRERKYIARVSNLVEFPFYAGARVVKVRYSAGYKGTLLAPAKAKGVCLELAAEYFQYADRKEFGLGSRSDALGSFQRLGPPMISKGMMNRLAAYLRDDFAPTGCRDFDLEAA